MKSAIPALLILVLVGCATDPPRVAGGIARGEPAPGLELITAANMPVSTGPATRPARVLEDMTATARQRTIFGKKPSPSANPETMMTGNSGSCCHACAARSSPSFVPSILYICQQQVEPLGLEHDSRSIPTFARGDVETLEAQQLRDDGSNGIVILGKENAANPVGSVWHFSSGPARH